MKHLHFFVLLCCTATCANAADIQFKPGIYATEKAGCAALKRGTNRTLDTDDIAGGAVTGTTANFLIVEKSSLGAADFECQIGKRTQKGNTSVWPLLCDGESSGGKNSTMVATRKDQIKFTGGLAEFGTLYFCK
jgi:hypothetical protein